MGILSYFIKNSSYVGRHIIYEEVIVRSDLVTPKQF